MNVKCAWGKDFNRATAIELLQNIPDTPISVHPQMRTDYRTGI